jgi:hypothetical protein
MLVRPSEYLVELLVPALFPPPVVLFWNWHLVQSFCPVAVSTLWVDRSHCAVGHSLGFVVCPMTGRLTTVQQ